MLSAVISGHKECSVRLYSSWVHVIQSLVVCVDHFYLFVLFLLAIIFSVFLQFTDSNFLITTLVSSIIERYLIIKKNSLTNLQRETSKQQLLLSALDFFHGDVETTAHMLIY